MTIDVTTNDRATDAVEAEHVVLLFLVPDEELRSARRHGSVTIAAASPAMTFVIVNASVEAIAPVTRPSDAFNVTSSAKRMLADPKMYVSGTVAQNRNDALASVAHVSSNAAATLRV